MEHFTERDAVATASGRWGAVEKTQYREITVESGVLVPALQALIVALGVFGVVFMCAWQTIMPPKLAAIAGGVLGLAAFTGVVGYAMYDSRTSVQYCELWESESNNSGGAESSRVTIEEVHRQSGAISGELASGDSVQYRQLDVDSTTLALVARDDTVLSKRGLMGLGINDSTAMRLLAQLEALSYISRNASNEPAQWTSRGRALVRAVAGGGGGGDALVVGGGEYSTTGVGEYLEVENGS